MCDQRLGDNNPQQQTPDIARYCKEGEREILTNQPCDFASIKNPLFKVKIIILCHKLLWGLNSQCGTGHARCLEASLIPTHSQPGRRWLLFAGVPYLKSDSETARRSIRAREEIQAKRRETENVQRKKTKHITLKPSQQNVPSLYFPVWCYILQYSSNNFYCFMVHSQ